MRTILVCLVVVGICPCVLSFQPTKVNDSPTATLPRILAGPNGEWIVVYEDAWLDDAIVRFDRDGVRVFGPASIDSGGQSVSDPLVAWSGVNIGLAYSVFNGANQEYEVWFHTVNADGQLVSPPVFVSPSSVGKGTCCVDNKWIGGEFVVAYVSEVASGGFSRAISLRRVDAAGNLASPELPVFSTLDPNYVTWPHVGRVGNILVAAWFGAEPQGLYAASVDINGNPLGGPTQLVQENGMYLADAVSLPDRVTLYYDWNQGGFSTPAWQVQIDASSNAIGSPVQVGEDLFPVGIPSVAQAPWGVGIVHQYIPTSDASLALRRVSFDGAIASGSVDASSCPPCAPGYFHRTGYMDRAYAFAWEDFRETPGESDVYIASAPAHEVMALGAGPDPAAAPAVTIWQPESLTGSPVATIVPYGAGGYGANVGGGDVNGDESDEVLTGPGPGEVYGPQIRAFAWRGTPVAKVNYYAYGTLKYGAKVASASLDSDGPQEILTGPGPGEVFGPHVRGWNYDGGTVGPISKVNFFAYSTLRYGVNVEAGDVDDDGFEEILTGPGPGPTFGSQLRGFDYDGTQVRAMSRINTFVYAAFTHGLHMASGEVDGDWIDEIGCGPGPAPGNDTRLVFYDYYGISGLAELPGSRFEAFAGSVGGARLAFVQGWDADFATEIVASRGPLLGNASDVAAFDDAAQGFAALGSFDPYPGQGYGVSPGACFTGF